MPANVGSEFIVKLNGLKLPAGAEAKINAAIQQTVLQELARLDLRDDVGFHLPLKEWLGLWVERLGKLNIPLDRIKAARENLRS